MSSDQQHTTCYAVTKLELRENQGRSLTTMIAQLREHPAASVLLLITPEGVDPTSGFAITHYFTVSYQAASFHRTAMPSRLSEMFPSLHMFQFRKWEGESFTFAGSLRRSAASLSEYYVRVVGTGSTPHEALLAYERNLLNVDEILRYAADIVSLALIERLLGEYIWILGSDDYFRPM